MARGRLGLCGRLRLTIGAAGFGSPDASGVFAAFRPAAISLKPSAKRLFTWSAVMSSCVTVRLLRVGRPLCPASTRAQAGGAEVGSVVDAERLLDGRQRALVQL